MKAILGIGRFTWFREERVSDRYGFVYLLHSGDSMSNGHDVQPMNIPQELVGKPVRLVAKVIETRDSTHIGDFFHGVYPVTPEVGERIVFGEGVFAVDVKTDGPMCVPNVGVKPFDGRPTLWLDIKKLYRAHEQTVELFVEVL